MDSYNQNVEKKRFGIALRRYIWLKSPCHRHQRYFGCDAEWMNKFVEHQFREGWAWINFGTEWQIDHIVPQCVFDFGVDKDLRMCWNWINIRPLSLSQNKARNSFVIALSVLKKRKECFPGNPVIDGLIIRAEDMAAKEENVNENWEEFLKTNPFIGVE